MRSWEKDGGWELGSLEGNNSPGTIFSIGKPHDRE
jgi:hypothetical protein